jgi:hypothetical protein
MGSVIEAQPLPEAKSAIKKQVRSREESWAMRVMGLDLASRQDVAIGLAKKA